MSTVIRSMFNGMRTSRARSSERRNLERRTRQHEAWLIDVVGLDGLVLPRAVEEQLERQRRVLAADVLERGLLLVDARLAREGRAAADAVLGRVEEHLDLDRLPLAGRGVVLDLRAGQHVRTPR